MYGLVNKAMKGFVIKSFDEEKWRSICDKANFDDYDFLSFKSYPDDLTYRLVGAASQELNMSAESILEAFGEGYSDMLDVSGTSFHEFIGNLDMLHFRVSNIMPELRPPMFTSTLLDDNSLELEYNSHRPGLTPMVVGLIRGLGKRFNLEVHVTLIEPKSVNGIHDRFHVSWK
jgi:Haem-NO-binding